MYVSAVVLLCVVFALCVITYYCITTCVIGESVTFYYDAANARQRRH